jgi:AT-rich interactive domain-containing protein 1
MQNHLPPNSSMGPMGPTAPHQSQVMPQYPHPQLGSKRDHMTFPPDSVEATMPVLYKRRRMARSDVSPVDAWRIMMSLRSGLLAESCWALDVLNVLLFDDASVAYFGLGNLPGLLDVLLEHFRRSLADMFDETSEEEEDKRTRCIAAGGVDKKPAITEKKW